MIDFALIRRRLQKNNFLVGAFITSWLLPVITNFLSSWLQQQFGPTQSRLIQLCAIGIVLLVGLWAFAQIMGKGQPLNLVTKEMQPPQFPGLVVLIGPGRVDSDPQKLSHNIAIEYHLKQTTSATHLRVCWLIATAGEKGSVDLAQKVSEHFEARGVKMVIHILKDAFDVQEAYECIQQIYIKEAPAHNLTSDQIMGDFTGGTKPMSAGLLLVCQDRWPLQYIYGREGVIKSAPVQVRFQAKS